MSIFMTLCSFAALIITAGSIRVCENFEDYYKSTDSPNCWDNLDSDRNVTEIINNWGVEAEEYIVTTKDGYNLLLVRAHSKITKKCPIILAHGIYSNSNFFVFNYNKSLAYNLIVNGYEVFILNFRGTLYNSHQNLTSSDKNYWNFSFHEMGILDLKLFLDKIYEITCKKSILIGYSMGSSISYIYSSEFPEEAKQKLTGMISLAPIAYMKNIESILNKLIWLWPILKPVTNYLWPGRAIPRDAPVPLFCSKSPAKMMVCESIRAIIFGEDLAQLDPVYFPVQYRLIPDAVSAEVFTHYCQIIKFDRFQQKDYGETENLKKYGQKNPPIYDLAKIPIPVALIHGKNDLLATSSNVRRLYSSLSTCSRCGIHYVKWRKWNHVDYGFSKDVKDKLYGIILQKLQTMELGLCDV